MHLLVLDLGSTCSFRTFGIQFSSSDLMPGYEASEEKTMENRGKLALNEEIPVHEWQRKVKHVMKELNSW